MNTYDVNALALVIIELATQSFDGCYSNDDDWYYSDKDVFNKHFVLDTNEPDPVDYTGCFVNDGMGKRLFISNKVLKQDTTTLGVFENAVSTAQMIKVEDQYGNYTKYTSTTNQNSWLMFEVKYVDEVREAGECFILYANIRHDALLKLTDCAEAVLSSAFHECFDKAVIIAKQQWQKKST